MADEKWLEKEEKVVQNLFKTRKKSQKEKKNVDSEMKNKNQVLEEK